MVCVVVIAIVKMMAIIGAGLAGFGLAIIGIAILAAPMGGGGKFTVNDKVLKGNDPIIVTEPKPKKKNSVTC